MFLYVAFIISHQTTNNACSFSLKASDIKQHTQERAETPSQKEKHECAPCSDALT